MIQKSKKNYLNTLISFIEIPLTMGILLGVLKTNLEEVQVPFLLSFLALTTLCLLLILTRK